MSGSTISTNLTIGVTLGSGGYDSPLTVTSTGTVQVYGSPASSSNAVSGAGTVVNAGQLIGQGGYYGAAGIYLQGGANAVVNTGVIDGGYGDLSEQGGGGYGGVGVALNTGSIDNSGTIYGGSGDVGGVGVSIYSGSLTNSGFIQGGYGDGGEEGAAIRSAAASSQAVRSDLSYGAGLYAKYASVDNSGTIAGGRYGGTYEGIGAVLVGSTFVNSGTLTPVHSGPGGIGFRAFDGSVISNEASGGIDAGYLGGVVLLSTLTNAGTIGGAVGVVVAEGTVINSGTIIGVGGSAPGELGSLSGDAVYLAHVGESDVARDGAAASSASTLIVDPGAVFIGNVVAQAGDGDVLEVSGTSATQLSGIGGQFTGFDNVSFASGASWAVEGNESGLAAGQTITGFTLNDTIFLDGFVADSHSYVTGEGLVLGSGGGSETLDIAGSFTTGDFTVIDQTNATEILLCYLRGTRLSTPAGEVPVERLAIGDTLVTRFGGYRRIKWIGRQSYDARFIRGNREQIPVRINAGALGHGLPKRDLWVSPGHAMLLGGALVLASTLVNGVTVTQDHLPDEVHYYQVEFEGHDCVLAEGAWSESFCDYAGLRNQFHNVAEFHALYPHHVTPAAHLMCAPRPQAGPDLAAALTPVAAHAAARIAPGPLQGWIDEIAPDGTIRGWARDLAHPDLPVLLEVLADGRRIGQILACDPRPDIAAAGIGAGNCGFSFTSDVTARLPATEIRVVRTADGAGVPMAPHCLPTATLAKPKRRRAA